MLERGILYNQVKFPDLDGVRSEISYPGTSKSQQSRSRSVNKNRSSTSSSNKRGQQKHQQNNKHKHRDMRRGSYHEPVHNPDDCEDEQYLRRNQDENYGIDTLGHDEDGKRRPATEIPIKTTADVSEIPYVPKSYNKSKRTNRLSYSVYHVTYYFKFFLYRVPSYESRICTCSDTWGKLLDFAI
jgi:hypothetical protein